MPASLYLQNQWLNHTFGNTPFAQPTAWWVQLHYGDPGINCTNNAWDAAGRSEVDDFTPAAAKANASDEAAVWLDLPDPGVNTSITHISIWDADITAWPAVIGNPLTYGELTIPVTVAHHSALIFNSGDITNTVT